MLMPSKNAPRPRVLLITVLSLAVWKSPIHAADATVDQDELRKQLTDCLDNYYRRSMLNSQEHSPWEIMHMVIGYGIDAAHYSSRSGSDQVNSIAWLCYNNSCRGQRMLYLYDGRPRPRSAAGLEGHPGQFLSALALSGVSKDYPMKVSGREFTVADLIEQEKRTCRGGTELSFKLIGLVHYLDSDETWESEQGDQWNIPRLIKEEIAQPIIGGTCGGTHRMTGLGYAVRVRLQRGEPIDGEWARAKKYVDDYYEYAFKLQNSDGSMSTSYFRGPSRGGTVEDRLTTTGHVLEWLVLSLPDQQLQDERVNRAVKYLIQMLNQHRDRRWSVGSLGHAIHALVVYEQRVFGAKPGLRRQ